METMRPKIHSVSTDPAMPVAGRSFKLTIEGENFKKYPNRLLYYRKTWDKDTSPPSYPPTLFYVNRHLNLPTFVNVYLPMGKYIERSEKRVVFHELIKEAGIYYVSMIEEEGNNLNIGANDFAITVERPVEGQETPGAGGKPAHQFKVVGKKVCCNNKGRVRKIFEFLKKRWRLLTTIIIPISAIISIITQIPKIIEWIQK